MWSYVVTWLPLLSISLTAAICFGVASFVMRQQSLVLARFDVLSIDVLSCPNLASPLPNNPRRAGQCLR